MSRPFPLATVARVRRIRTGLARMEVARCNTVERMADASRVVALAAMQSQPSLASIDELLTSDGFVSAAHSRLRHAHDLEVAEAQLVEAIAQRRAALDAWQAARASERVTDLLEVAHLESVAAAEQAVEQRQADDRSGARWFATRQAPAS